MNRICVRRQLWKVLSAWIGTAGGLIFAGTAAWIGLLAPESPSRLTLIRAVTLLLLGVALACIGSIITALLRLTDSPALTAALRFLETPAPAPLRIVEPRDNTAG